MKVDVYSSAMNAAVTALQANYLVLNSVLGHMLHCVCAFRDSRLIDRSTQSLLGYPVSVSRTMRSMKVSLLHRVAKPRDVRMEMALRLQKM